MGAAKKTNGTKAIPEMVPVCPHQDVCQAPSRQAELMASIDEVSKGVGMMLERHEELALQVVEVERGVRELTRHITRVSEESLDRARIYIESNDSILTALRRLEGRDAV